MLGPAVQFREFKLPLGTHWKDNKHFYKGIFLLDWSGEQINNSEKRQIVRQEVEVIVLNLLCECLRTSNWLCSFSQSWWDQILSQVVILELFIRGMRWVELITDQLFCGGCGHFYVCVLDLKKTLSFWYLWKIKVSILEDEIINTLALLIYSNDSNDIHLLCHLLCCSWTSLILFPESRLPPSKS